MSYTNKRKISTPINKPDNRRISVIIPAAGVGTRMKSYGPKSLIKVREDMTILQNQLRYIFKYCYRPEVILVTGFGSNQIEKELEDNRIKVVYNKNWEHANVVSSINIGLQHATHDNVLIIYGDLVFNAWTLKAPFGIYSMLLTDDYGLMKSEEVGCIIRNNIVIQMMYDLPNKWAQIAYLTNDELDMFYELCKVQKNHNKFGFEIINYIIMNSGIFTSYAPKRMRITDIDSSKDLRKVEEII